MEEKLIQRIDWVICSTFLCVLFFKAWRAPHLELAVRNIKPDQTLAPKRKTAPELLKSHCQHVNKDLVGLVGRSVLFTVDGASSFPSPLVFLLNTLSCHSDIKFSNFRDHKRAFFPNVRILLLKRLQSHWLKGILWHIFCHYYNVHNVQPEVWFTVKSPLLHTDRMEPCLLQPS